MKTAPQTFLPQSVMWAMILSFMGIWTDNSHPGLAIGVFYMTLSLSFWGFVLFSYWMERHEWKLRVRRLHAEIDGILWDSQDSR